MAVVGDSGLPQDAGRRDALHHRERLRRKITEQLKERIGEEDIVAAGPEKRIRVPVKGTKRWQFILDRGKGGGRGAGRRRARRRARAAGGRRGPGEAGTEPGEEIYEVWLDMEDVEELLFSELELPRLRPRAQADAEATRTIYDDIARKGPQLDKKATLRENLLRNAKMGAARAGRDREARPALPLLPGAAQAAHKAVIFLAMDVSGSMDASRKRIARLFFYWCVQFLRRRYDQTELVFIAHTTEAREVTEHEFFNRMESGGTRVSSAFETVLEIQQDRFPAEDWNIYVLHVSDGDNFAADNRRTIELVRRLASFCSLVGYLEVDPRAGAGRHKLSAHYQKEVADLEGFVFAAAAEDRALWPALKRFFARDRVEEVVR